MKACYLALLMLLLLGAGSKQPDLALAPARGIEGRWTMLFHNGNPYPPGYFWVIDGSKIEIVINGKHNLTMTYSARATRAGWELKVPGYARDFQVTLKNDRLLVYVLGTPYDFKRVR